MEDRQVIVPLSGDEMKEVEGGSVKLMEACATGAIVPYDGATRIPVRVKHNL